MASGIDTQKPSDLTVCSICFEKFRTPRILPCTHVFCHGCISSYIISSCQSKEAPVGFSCPLCREFVPSPNLLESPEKWADGLPECRILDKLNKGERNMCAACLRESEEEEATDICVTCEETICGNCAKYHKRSLASRNHVVASLNKPIAILRTVSSFKANHCPEHRDKEEEMYCNDHRRVCCTVCAGTEHRNCVNFNTVQSVAKKLKERGDPQVLLKTIDCYREKLIEIKSNQEQNLKEIENASDTIKEQARQLRMEINEHFDKLEQENLDELGQITKKSSEILRKTIDSVSDRICLSDQYKDVLSNLKDATDACLVKKYQTVCEGFRELKLEAIPLKNHRLKLQCAMSKEAYDFRNVKCLFSMELLNSNGFKMFQFLFSLAFEFDVVPHDDIYCGDLTNGRLTLAKYGSSKVGLQQFSVFYNTVRQTNEYRSFNCFFGLVFRDNLFYATDRNANAVDIISSDFLTLARTFPVKEKFTPYGICLWNEYLFVACQTAILKYDVHGRFIHCYPVEFNTLFVAVTTIGNIVYSNTVLNFVSSIDNTGKQLWKYTNPKLQGPHGVDKDKIGNLLVASTKTNSVHILSSDGTLLRIIEDIPRPVFMKIDENSRSCCVCSNFRNIQVYRID